MRRIAVIGSSHVGAFKEGADVLKSAGELGKVEITVFGTNGSSLRSCRIEDGAVVGGSDFVRSNFECLVISDYDDILVVAGLSFFSKMVFWAGEPEMPFYNLPPISRALAFDALEAISGRWDIQLARDIAQTGSGVPVRHLGCPLRSDEEPLSKLVLEKLEVPGSAIGERLGFLQTCIAEKANSLASDTFSFAKPPATVLEQYGLFTKHSFCRGSKRLTEDMSKEHPEDDYGHMNAEYGKALWQQLL
jgi:hypothetical protein